MNYLEEETIIMKAVFFLNKEINGTQFNSKADVSFQLLPIAPLFLSTVVHPG